MFSGFSTVWIRPTFKSGIPLRLISIADLADLLKNEAYSVFTPSGLKQVVSLNKSTIPQTHYVLHLRDLYNQKHCAYATNSQQFMDFNNATIATIKGLDTNNSALIMVNEVKNLCIGLTPKIQAVHIVNIVENRMREGYNLQLEYNHNTIYIDQVECAL